MEYDLYSVCKCIPQSPLVITKPNCHLLALTERGVCDDKNFLSAVIGNCLISLMLNKYVQV